MSWHVEINCVCDVCGRNNDDPNGSKQEAWDAVYRDGWRRIDGQHLCYECVYQKTGRWTAPFERDPDDVIDTTPVDWSEFSR